MPSLEKNLRKTLENTVKAARKIAEAGGLEAVNALAVGEKESFAHMGPDEKALRNRLRARGRAAGDVRDSASGKQTIEHLVAIVAYEHWHRMLFARLLAENGLLLEPEHQVSVSLDDVEELARDEGMDVWELAGRYAEKMLPQIFRSDDPALEVDLARESRVKLEQLLADLPRNVFTADDSLGWVYQFWQADQKDRVNKSGVKVGADELPAVTQLFTEDYMVEFLLHNTLGAWWAGKLGPIEAADEEDARAVASLDEKDGVSVTWTYLRFMRDEKTRRWTPAAGTFDDWPKAAKEITFLDPCMGSGHFLSFALPILTRTRMEEEHSCATEAISAVLRDNLHGLEIDPRCSQIAAFNVALTAWKLGGYQLLPELHLACCGVGPIGKREEWMAVLEGRGGQDLRFFMGALYDHFKQASTFGSLINPIRLLGGIFDHSRLHQLLEAVDAAIKETHPNLADDYQVGVVAHGLAKSVELLVGRYVCVTTNVPYLARGKQSPLLMEFIERMYPMGKADLATAFVLRAQELLRKGGTATLVTPQNWLFLKSYRKLREKLLSSSEWNWTIRIGEYGFQSSQAAGAFTALICVSRSSPANDHEMIGIDVSGQRFPSNKSERMMSGGLVHLEQRKQLENPESLVSFVEQNHDLAKLGDLTECYQGAVTGDLERFRLLLMEVPECGGMWDLFRTTVESRGGFEGCYSIIRWEGGSGQLHDYAKATRHQLHDMHESGNRAWGRQGIAVNRMRGLVSSSYAGEIFDNNVATIIPTNPGDLAQLYAFCLSDEFPAAVRALDQSLKVTNQTLIKVPFDRPHWTTVAEQRFSGGLPEPYTVDPSQWLSKGRIDDSAEPLQVAVARLLGYRWPVETNPERIAVEIYPADREHWSAVDVYADEDGIVCLNALRNESPAVDRVNSILNTVFELAREKSFRAPSNWLDSEIPIAPRPFGFASMDNWVQHLLQRAGATSMHEFLRDVFFEEHCKVFRQRPFIWHISDGRQDGFHALVNYHKLAAPDGEGHKLLESLTYSYLGDWIRKQSADAKQGTPGAEDRLVAAESLQRELKNILTGEPPYDIFVRWKSLSEQAVGWNPDVNDGVRLNIRPFLCAKDMKRRGAGILRSKPKIKWAKDRGKDPHRPKDDFPWFWTWDGQSEDFKGAAEFDGHRWNDLHYSNKTKLKAKEGNYI